MKEESQAIKEYRQAFNDFFKDKPKPKNEEEHKKMLEEFFNWYNNERKQSDTGKTPAEMYKEIYGEEAPNPVNLDEEDSSEEQEAEMREFFDEKFWPKMKKDLKESTKKEACFLCFVAGTEIANNMFEEEMNHAQETFEKISPEEIKKMMKKEAK